MPTEIDSLLIKIESQSDDVASNIDALVAALSKLKGTVSGLNKASKELNKLGNSMEDLKNKSAGVEKLSKSLTGLKTKMAVITIAAQKAFSAIGSWVNSMNSYVENVNLFTVSMGEYADEER